MSHVTHTNESCHTYEWVMSHIWMSHVTRMMNESCHTRGCAVWFPQSIHTEYTSVCRVWMRTMSLQSVHTDSRTNYEYTEYRVAKNHRMPYLTGHFAQKSPIISGSSAKNDRQLKASYGFLLRYMQHSYDSHTPQEYARWVCMIRDIRIPIPVRSPPSEGRRPSVLCILTKDSCDLHTLRYFALFR